MDSEKEKMLSGQMYFAGNEGVLFEERLKCKTLCQEYNNLPVANLEERRAFLKRILGSVKENYHIEPNFYCDYGYNISVGENFYSNHNLVILDPARVTFGDNVFIGPNCGFYTTIGDNVVIGAGSVVTKDIPSNVVAVGNPCKVLKKL